MKAIIVTVAMLFVIAIGMSYAYGEEVEIPFEADDKQCQLSFDQESNQFKYACLWTMIPTDEEILIIAESDPELVPENVVDAILAQEEVVVEKIKPLTTNEKKIIELQETLEKEGSLVSHEDQLLMALLSLQEECELGTEEGAPIQDYESFTIATFEPYTHTDLGTQYILDKIERAIEKCKAQQTLKSKVLGDQYLHIPSTNQPKIIWTTNATLPADVQAKYDEAKMFDYFLQKTTNDAEDFKCTKEGRARGLGYDCKAEEDQVIPEVEISQAGMEVLANYNAYQQTGIADIPKQEPGEVFDPTISLDQYINAYGITDEQLKEWYEKRVP